MIVSILLTFLMVSWAGMRCVIVVFPVLTRLFMCLLDSTSKGYKSDGIAHVRRVRHNKLQLRSRFCFNT